MNTTSEEPVTWAGIAEVVPRRGNDLLGAATGAHVAAVGLARSESEFRSALIRAMSALDFEVVEVDDVRQICLMTDLVDFDDSLRNRVNALHADNPIELGSFRAFSD
jgi:hypothetical protein